MDKFNSTKYKNDFNKHAYDRLNIQVPKGHKAIIEKHWRAKGYKSLNAYVNALIEADMQQSTITCKVAVNVKSSRNLDRLRLIARARAGEKKYQIEE